jgi:hypothetical protein
MTLMLHVRKFTVICMLLLLVGVGVNQAQEGQRETLSERLRAQITSLEEVTVTLRGLDALRPVILQFPSRDAVRAYIETAINESLNPEALAEMDAFYKGFGFVPADYDLLQELIALYGQQVAGYYDPETQEMNVILFSGEAPSTQLPVLEQIIYVHEFVHALQDHHFDLLAYTSALESEDNNDLILARMALVEGDASAIMNEYTARAAQANPLGTLLSVALGSLRAGNLTLPPGTPAAIGAELLFPYQQGEVFVRALYAGGGWEAVNAAYSNPPQSTEQILHPERYLDGDSPLTVALDDQSAALGNGWMLADDGVMGEFYLLQWLQAGGRLADSELTAADAAAGWGGDRYHIYQTASDERAWALEIHWDSASEAEQFLDFVGLQAVERYGMPAEAETFTCYTEELTLCVQHSEQVTRITQAVSPQQAQALLSTP